MLQLLAARGRIAAHVRSRTGPARRLGAARPDPQPLATACALTSRCKQPSHAPDPQRLCRTARPTAVLHWRLALASPYSHATDLRQLCGLPDRGGLQPGEYVLCRHHWRLYLHLLHAWTRASSVSCMLTAVQAGTPNGTSHGWGGPPGEQLASAAGSCGLVAAASQRHSLSSLPLCMVIQDTGS
jgi:hypothetical protein